MSGVEIVAVGDLSPEQQVQARALYESSFPPSLRDSFEGLFRDEVLAYVDDHVRGLAVVRRLVSRPWSFLRYFCVGDRGQGTGSRMWGDLCGHLGESSRIVLDVESPHETGIDPGEVVERQRRIAFYERLGVQVLPVSDYCPPHGEELVPMMLLTRSLAEDEPRTPGAEETRDILLTVYRDRYGLGADDPVVTRTLAASRLTR